MPHGLDSMLHHPDNPRWQDVKGYSTTFATALAQAYTHIKRDLPRTRGYVRARRELGPYLSAPLIKPQRLLMCYVLAMASAAERDYLLTLRWLDEALDLAQDLGELDASVELAFFHGSINRALCQFALAAQYHTLCLETLWAHADLDPEGFAEPDLELSTFVELAMSHTLLADFESADWCLQEAVRLTPLAPGSRLEAAMIPWIKAVLAQYRGQLATALGDAMQACDAITVVAAGSPISQSLINTVVADIALEMAEQYPDGPSHRARSSLVQLAQPYVNSAVRLASEGDDLSSEGLALLAHARYDRLNAKSAPETHRVRTIEAVLHSADLSNDAPLHAQAHVALGKELAACGGGVDAQINCYDRAVETLAASDAHAIELLAAREAWRAREMRDL